MAMSIPTLLALIVTSIAPAPGPGESTKTVTFTGTGGRQYIHHHCYLDSIGSPKVGDVMGVSCRTWEDGDRSGGVTSIDNFRVLDCRRGLILNVLSARDKSDLARMLDGLIGRACVGDGEYQLVLRSMRDLDEMQAMQAMQD